MNSAEASILNTSGTISFFTLIEAPVILSVNSVHVMRFLKERERYELEIDAK